MDPEFRHFLDAQEESYQQACAEIGRGRKISHWMWYIFPQLSGLGYSEMARRFAMSDLDEARRYLAHPVLGARLVHVSRLLLDVTGKSAYDIFGSPDDLKLRSSMTLFSSIPGVDRVFADVIDRFYDGKPDQRTADAVR